MTASDGPYYERTETIVQTPLPPPVQTAPVDERVVVPVAPVDVTPVPTARARTAYTSRFAPDAVIAAVVGLVILVIGLIAITRAGFDGPMNDPVVEVLGFTHTATLGLIEIGIGLCLLISGATRSRSGALFFGTVLGIGGFVGAVQTESFTKSLALESAMAWLALFAGAIVVIAALTLPRVVTRSTTIEEI